jgi:hypothetical protein
VAVDAVEPGSAAVGVVVVLVAAIPVTAVEAVVVVVVVVVPGPVVVKIGTWVETVTTPRPNTENRKPPPTMSAARNIPSATLAGTDGLVVPGGSTTSPPWSRSTEETKRPPTTSDDDDGDGTPDPDLFLATVVQAHKAPAVTTNASARTRCGRGGTGHSLPAPRR